MFTLITFSFCWVELGWLDFVLNLACWDLWVDGLVWLTWWFWGFAFTFVFSCFLLDLVVPFVVWVITNFGVSGACYDCISL